MESSAYSIPYGISSHVKANLRNPYHAIACLAFSVVFGLSIFSWKAALTGTVIFTIATTMMVIMKNAHMLMFCFLLIAACSVFPILSPLAALVMIYFFLRRINLIFTHWRPIVLGLVVYILPFLAPQLGKFSFPTWAVVSISLFAGLVLHLSLRRLYIIGYNTENALMLMGAVPLLILLLILPFLKLDLVFEVPEFDFTGSPEFVNHGEIIGGAKHFEVPSSVAFSKYNHYVHHDVPPPPGYHHVKPYIRHAPDGDIELVKGHVRTNPDGIEENNLSYKG